MGINLLQDREIIKENNKKKKSSRNFDMTNPAVQKDETRAKIKKGGVIEFLKNIFKQPPKIKIQTEEEIIKDVPEIKKTLNRVRGTSLRGARYIRKGSEPEKTARQEEPLDVARDKPLQVKRQEPSWQKMGQSVPILKPRLGAAQDKPFNFNVNKSSAFIKTPAMPARLDSARLVKRGDWGGKILDKTEKSEINKMAPGVPKADSDSGLDVNLIPEDIRIKLEPKRKLKVLILAVGLCVGVVLLLWGGMIWQQRKIQKNIQEVIAASAQVEQEIATYESVRKTGEQLNSKISQAQAVLDSHVYWTKFLAELENYTLPDVYYQNMAASLNGTVTLSAQAPDLPTLAKQYQVMQNASEFIKSVAITAAAISAEGESKKVTFNIALTVNPEVFFQRITEPTK